jgi:ubiquinone/menaquinone biosynthesis C-methylase UbiE
MAPVVCAVCQGSLQDWICTACGRRYLPDVMVPEFARDSDWQRWEVLQRNGELEYEREPSSSLSVGEREDAAAFAAFCRLSGVVLDVGCGPQTRPSYAAGFEGEFVGIDPIDWGDHDFQFVRALAEYLPFPDGTFDHVLFATSIDHVVDKPRALAEARRVLGLNGHVHVWIGVPDSPRRGALGKIADSIYLARHGRLRELFSQSSVEPDEKPPEYEVPEGAIDAFHVEHPSAEQVTEWFEAAGLTIMAEDSATPGRRFLSGSPAPSSPG